MVDNLDRVMKQLESCCSRLGNTDNLSNLYKQIDNNLKTANKHLASCGHKKARESVHEIETARDELNFAIIEAKHYVHVVAEITGKNTVSEEVLAFLRIENRLTDLNMAEVSLFEVGEYSALKNRPGRDGMEMDHIPSKAALCKATCRYIEDKIDKKLNDMEVAAVLQVVEKLGGAIAVPKEMHDKLSRTIGGRNTKTRIHRDSLDIIRAIKADVDAYTPELRRRGYSDNDIEMIYNDLVNRFNHVMEQVCQQK